MIHKESTSSVDKQTAYSTVLTFLKHVRKEGKTSAKDWNAFRRELSHCALQTDTLKAIDLWTMENLEHHNPREVRPRVLHEFEEQFIPAKTHDEYLEALHYGMVSPLQGEQVIDELLEMNPQHVLPETMRQSLSQKWTRNVQNYRSMRIN